MFENCLSLWPLPIPSQYSILFFALLIAIAVLTLGANGILLYSLYKTNQTTSVTGKLIFLMNISDLLAGVIGYPLAATVFLLNRKHLTCTMELSVQFFILMLAYISFFMLFGVAIDRYFHVTKLNKYQTFVNDFRMKVYIGISVVVSIGMAMVSTMFSSFTLKIVLNVFNVLGILQMLFIYTKISKKISHHSRNAPQSNMSMQSRKRIRQQLSGTRTIRILIITLLLLFMPYNIISVFWSYYKFYRRVEPSVLLNVLESMAFAIIFLNTGVNAIIYTHGNSVTRRYVAGMFMAEVSTSSVGQQDGPTHELNRMNASTKTD